MLSSVRKCHLFACAERFARAGLVVSAAALAGCSADISRFDLGNPEGARAHSAGHSATTGRSQSAEFGSAGSYDRSYGGNSVARDNLPPPPQQDTFSTSSLRPQPTPPPYGERPRPSYNAQSQPYASPSYAAPAYQAPRHEPQQRVARGYDAAERGPSGYGGGVVPPIASEGAGARGDVIEVRAGDTLYSLSRRHNVSLDELMTLNGLSSPNIKPGQRLHLPAGSQGGSAVAGVGRATQTARPPREDYEVPSVAAHAAEAPSDWSGSYTVRPGDSLYGIARQHGVKLSDLERYNGIADSRKVKPGTVLRLPGRDAPAAAVAEVSPPPAATAPVAPVAEQTSGAVQLGEVRAGPAPTPSSAQQPTLLNGSGATARAETPGSVNDALSPARRQQQAGSLSETGRLRWPVAGKMISGFGPRPDGTHNDGVNLAAPMGTDVHAAESGVVAYAGDELKGYGNLVLLRHDNGWVTAYAHADEILVKRGDRIKRGQVIAKAGRTGQVDQPQVHFELRQGQKPVDPTPFMERL